MNFTVSSSDLLKQLQKAAGTIGTNPVMAILEGFKFSINSGELEITGTDLQTTIVTRLAVMAEDDFEFVIPAKLLIDTLKATPDQPVEFTLDEDESQIKLTTSVGQYAMAIQAAEEYPVIDELEGANKVELESLMVQQAFGKTIFATSGDESRLPMTGVYMSFEEDNVFFVSTDGNKLVEYTYSPTDANIISGKFIVPKKSSNLIRSSLPEQGLVELSFNTQHASFKIQDTLIICRLLDANYPNYKAVIPQNNEIELTINRNDLLNSLKRISVFANKSTNQIILSLAENSLTISAKDIDYSNEAKEQMACFYKDDAMDIGLNAKVLQEMIAHFESEEVIFKINTPTKAILIYPSETIDNESYFMLIMPVIY